VQPEHPSDPEPKTIELARGRAAYCDTGAGPAVVMVHGLPGSNRDFRWLSPCLEADLRVVRLDMPGFGGTAERTGRGHRLSHQVTFVREVLDALEIDRCVVLGHSYGGGVAAQLAATDPDRVMGLALLSSVGLRRHRGLRNSRGLRTISAVLRVPLLRRALLPRLRDGFQKNGFPGSLPESEMVVTMHRIARPHIAPHRRNVRRLVVPTLTAWALDDRLIEHEVSAELGTACPRGPRLVFDTGGHNVQKTRAVEIGEALVPWVGSVLGA